MKINDSNYISRLQKKDERALEYVIDVYGGLLKAVIRRHLGSFGSEADISECLNDTFLGIWNNSYSFDSQRSSFKNWAAGVARFKALDALRKVSLRQNRQGALTADIAYNDQDLEKIDENQLSEETESLLKTLKPVDIELFRKIYVEEKPLEQVSQETGLKKDTIYSRLSRSRKRLKAQQSSMERSKP